MEYTDNELNALPYIEALKLDKRSYSKYYLSLLKKNHLILFAFCPIKDYNSQIIKMFLLFFSFGQNLIINALFFTDGTMHKIYVDEGIFNLSYQIPQIAYSFLISTFISIIIKNFAFSEKQVMEIKLIKTENELNKKEKVIYTDLNKRFVVYIVIIFIFLGLFAFIFRASVGYM